MLITICKGIVFSAVWTAALAAGWHYGRQSLIHLSRKGSIALGLLTFWSLLTVYMTLLTYTCDPLISDTGFTPFHTFQEIFVYRQYDLVWQLAFNVAMFVPFGILVCILFPKLSQLSMIFTLGLLISLGIECTQLFIGRSFDVDDVLCNSLGALIGCAMYLLWTKFVVKWFRNPGPAVKAPESTA